MAHFSFPYYFTIPNSEVGRRIYLRFSMATHSISRSTIFRLNIYGGCTNQVYFRAGEGTKFM